MQLSSEDNLRLNVLLAQELFAVRIDESKMIVYALTAKGEAKVPLRATGKDELYIKEVKALFSTKVMGSPGGYPVFLKRWTRMGQARDESLEAMLKLGEEEAVVAAVHAAGLTDELAARAWWAMPCSENARRMLEKKAVVEGETGKVLAEFLLEFLPFEEDQNDMIESVQLVLQPGLITKEEKDKLWKKAKNKRSFYVGFLHATPDDLPVESSPHPLYEETKQLSNTLNANDDNKQLNMLLKTFSPAGQAFLQIVELALKKPNNQDVVVSLFSAIASYFGRVKPENYTNDCVDTICLEAKAVSDDLVDGITYDWAELTEAGDLKAYLTAMTILSCLSVKLLNPIFAHTDAIGTVMRKKIKPLSDPILEQLKVLQN